MDTKKPVQEISETEMKEVVGGIAPLIVGLVGIGGGTALNLALNVADPVGGK